ncbi:MAG: hemerythrin domain-containing protein [Nitrospirae bacterium]|nr:hemerythrin domain-containing protein [Nitrospirota bacterium]
MEKYLNKGIKAVITEFPAIGAILDGYNIGCTLCGVGTCLLKDIVQVHNLSPEDEHSLMARISSVIYPDREVEMSFTPSVNAAPKPRSITYSPPMQGLVDEHTVIKRVLAMIPVIIETLDVSRYDDRRLVLDTVDFIRSYADKYHHAKEEEILFKEFDPNLEMVKVFNEDHMIGRGHVKAILEGLEKNDNQSVKEHLIGYRELLTGHIKREDEVLYPWMDRNLSITQVGSLSAMFTDVDRQFMDVREKQEAFVNRLEETNKFEEVR